MNTKICPICEAKWLEGQHYWSTGAVGNEEDLAGLVCNNYGGEKCINPCKGVETGDTWEKRLELLTKLEKNNEN